MFSVWALDRNFLLRTAGNAGIGALGSVSSQISLNRLDCKNGSLVKAAEVGAGFGAFGSIVGDAAPWLVCLRAQASTESLTAGKINQLVEFAVFNHMDLSAPSRELDRLGVIIGSVVGGGSDFVSVDDSNTQ